MHYRKQKHRKQKTKSFAVISSLAGHVLLGPAVYIHDMPFCVIQSAQCVSCFSTHHEYSPTQNLKATRVFLITKNTLHQLNLLEKKL